MQKLHTLFLALLFFFFLTSNFINAQSESTPPIGISVGEENSKEEPLFTGIEIFHHDDSVRVAWYVNDSELFSEFVIWRKGEHENSFYKVENLYANHSNKYIIVDKREKGKNKSYNYKVQAITAQGEQDIWAGDRLHGR